MLVTFNAPGHGRVTLFGEVAVQLLRMMGHSGNVPGALPGPDVQGALKRLQHAVASAPDAPPAPASGDDDEDEEPPVSIRHRALPLIELMQAAASDGKQLMWDRGT